MGDFPKQLRTNAVRLYRDAFHLVMTLPGVTVDRYGAVSCSDDNSPEIKALVATIRAIQGPLGDGV